MENARIIEGAFERSEAVLKQSFGAIGTEVQRSAEMLLEIALRSRTLFVCGNGGSAADAGHLVGEWRCRYKKERGPLRAVTLGADVPSLTAIANDYAFEEVFARELKALGSPEDVLVAISTSGKSPNVLKALEEARRKKMKTIMLTGEHGASLKGKADIVIAVPSAETARIQEVHTVILHAWCEFVDANIN